MVIMMSEKNRLGVVEEASSLKSHHTTVEGDSPHLLAKASVSHHPKPNVHKKGLGHSDCINYYFLLACCLTPVASPPYHLIANHNIAKLLWRTHSLTDALEY
jgi:hypothetical protein